MENNFGDKERAQTLFVQILNSYPKRVDILSCYIDSLVKSNDIDIARNVLERAVVQTLPPRKMKILFTKLISFEEQHSTQENILTPISLHHVCKTLITQYLKQSSYVKFSTRHAKYY